MDFRTYFRHYPDENGFFGPYGGCYVPEELQNALKEIAQAYQTIAHSAQFINELRRIRREFQGRPTPVYHCERLSRMMGSGGCQIYLKREDLNHTGAHKLNHCMGEGLLAKYMGKKKLIAETGAGSHGVALATGGRLFRHGVRNPHGRCGHCQAGGKRNAHESAGRKDRSRHLWRADAQGRRWTPPLTPI